MQGFLDVKGHELLIWCKLGMLTEGQREARGIGWLNTLLGD